MRQTIPPTHRRFALTMRADATKAENLLWQAIRNRQLEGLKFKRQVPLDGYILDFVCFEERLILEVDGGQHSENARDATRDAHFEAQGFRTIRFWNDEVECTIDGVCALCLRPLWEKVSPRMRSMRNWRRMRGVPAWRST